MLDFIINEKAGNGLPLKAKKTISQILDEKKIEYRFHPTEYRRHAIELTREICANGADTIIAVGGDGTVNEVLNGITDFSVKFGIIPCGSGNDFVSTAKIPLDVKKSLDLIISGDEPKPTDFLVCGGVRGINIIGAGIDVEILQRCENSKILKGKLQYLVSLIISLIKFKFYDFTVSYDDGTSKKGSGLIVACGNGRFFGGGIQMCPKAILDDGKIDVVIANKTSKGKIPSAFIQLMKGNVLKQSYIDFSLHDSLKVEFTKKVPVQIDGEIYDDLDFDMHIEKGKLLLYRP